MPTPWENDPIVVDQNAERGKYGSGGVEDAGAKDALVPDVGDYPIAYPDQKTEGDFLPAIKAPEGVNQYDEDGAPLVGFGTNENGERVSNYGVPGQPGSRERPESSIVGATGRGAVDAITLGFGDELHAAYKGAAAAATGGKFGDAYDTAIAHGKEQMDADLGQHPYAHVIGQLLGGLVLPAGLERAGVVAAVEATGLKAGRAALREGLPLADARVIAQRAVTRRLAAEGAAYGGAYGAGSADGDAGERLLGAAEGAAAGGAGGAAFGVAGGRLAARGDAARVASRARPLSDAERLERAAGEEGIDLLPADYGGDTAKRVTQGTAQSPYGASTIGNAARRTVDQFQDRVDDLAAGATSPEQAGGILRQTRPNDGGRGIVDAVQSAVGEPTDITGAGHLLQRGVSRFMDESQQTASRLYESIPIANSREASLNNTRAALSELTGGMESNPELSRLVAEDPRLKSYLTALTPKKGDDGAVQGGQLSWQDLKRFRSIVGEAVGQPTLTPDTSQVAMRKLYGALSEDMRDTAKQAGPGAYRSWSRANDYYDGRMKRVNETLSALVGERRDKTPNEALGAIERTLNNGPAGNPAALGQILRSLPQEDASVVRATLLTRATGGQEFDPQAFAKAWGQISDRAKSYLLPGTAQRQLMDAAADQASAVTRDPLAGKSNEQVFSAFTNMAKDSGNAAQFRSMMMGLSADEQSTVRATMIDRLGRATDAKQNAEGDAFSIGTFLTNWNKQLSPESKTVLFGHGELRGNLDNLARIAEAVKDRESFGGFSNTGAINAANLTNGGLATAALALLSGHPLIAAGAALPALGQRVSAEVLTSPRLTRWLVASSRKTGDQATSAHLARLGDIARAEPAIANEVFGLQQRLSQALGGSVSRAAAEQPGNEAGGVDRQDQAR